MPVNSVGEAQLDVGGGPDILSDQFDHRPRLAPDRVQHGRAPAPHDHVCSRDAFADLAVGDFMRIENIKAF